MKPHACVSWLSVRVSGLKQSHQLEDLRVFHCERLCNWVALVMASTYLVWHDWVTR